MKGLELRQSYWEEYASPILRNSFPQQFLRMTAGALGHGSEFLGLDDELSKDHDWGPGFSLFLTEKDYQDIGTQVFDILQSLPQEYKGYRPCWGSTAGSGRNGVGTFLDWLKRQCILDRIPQTDEDWLRISEYCLLWATNGRIWHDPLGEVSCIRKSLAYYPESVWKKRLALKCHQLHQAGVYQTTRFAERGDFVTVDISIHKFTIHAMHMAFLLRKKYAPIYKWLHTMLGNLPDIPKPFSEAIAMLSSPISIEDKMKEIERVLDVIQSELEGFFPALFKVRGLLCDPDAFSGMKVAQEINNSILDTEFRKIHYLLQAGAWTDQ